jgi:hypothetical protein
MFSVIGSEKVAPDGVEHRPPTPSQWPETHAKLLTVTATLESLRGPVANVTWSPR